MVEPLCRLLTWIGLDRHSNEAALCAPLEDVDTLHLGELPTQFSSALAVEENIEYRRMVLIAHQDEEVRRRPTFGQRSDVDAAVAARLNELLPKSRGWSERMDSPNGDGVAADPGTIPTALGKGATWPRSRSRGAKSSEKKVHPRRASSSVSVDLPWPAGAANRTQSPPGGATAPACRIA